jgi:hypothetical protein
MAHCKALHRCRIPSEHEPRALPLHRAVCRLSAAVRHINGTQVMKPWAGSGLRSGLQSFQLTNGSKDGVLIEDLKTPCIGDKGSPTRKRKCIERTRRYGD